MSGGGAAGQRGRRTGGGSSGALSWVYEPHHYFRLLVPDWHLVRSSSSSGDDGGSAILLQATSDVHPEQSYMRLSVAYDDISWSKTTAADFCKGIQANLHSLVPGSEFVSAGPWKTPREGGAGGDGDGVDPPYQLTYRLTDPLDHSTLELINVVHSSNYGGRRRCYTVTFGCDAKDNANKSGAVAKLASKLLASFELGQFSSASIGSRVGPDNMGYNRGLAGSAGGSSGGAGVPARPTRGYSSVSDRSSDIDDEIRGHVPVWERVAAAAVSNNGDASQDGQVIRVVVSNPSSSSANVPLPDTPTSVKKLQWNDGSVPEAGLRYRYPGGSWTTSGVGSDDDTLGSFSLLPGINTGVGNSLVRRLCVAHTCDRREGSFKQVSLVAVDVTPLLDLISSRQASFPTVLADSGYQSPGSLLLAYLAWRYRSEVVEAGSMPHPPSGSGDGHFGSGENTAVFLPHEQGLRSWVDVFSQRWPGNASRVSVPLTAATATTTLVPRQTTIADTRSVGNSLLYKVNGWLRTAGNSALSVGGGGGAGTASTSSLSDSSPKRHGSSHSTLSSLDLESAPAEGLLLYTTSAVLIGLHEASITVRAPMPNATSRKARAAAAAADSSAAATTVVKRTFGHIVTCAFSSDVFGAYEPLAKAVFQSLEATDSPAPGPGTGAASASSK